MHDTDNRTGPTTAPADGVLVTIDGLPIRRFAGPLPAPDVRDHLPFVI